MRGRVKRTATRRPSSASNAVAGSSRAQQNFKLNATQVNREPSSSDDEETLEEYTDIHKMILQGVMGAGYMDCKGVKELFKQAALYKRCKLPTGKSLLSYIQSTVRRINVAITPFAMAIRSATCEITEKKYYMFLVTAELPIMKKQMYFTKAELDLFQKIMNLILEKNDFGVTKTQCINIVPELEYKRFTKVNGQDFVDKMIKLEYLVKVVTGKRKDDFKITLGFRAIREFETVFLAENNGVFGSCMLCNAILLNGLQCTNCTKNIHRACYKKYLQSCKHCPFCTFSWVKKEALRVRTNPMFVALPQAGSFSTGSGDSSLEKTTENGNSCSENDTRNAATNLEINVDSNGDSNMENDYVDGDSTFETTAEDRDANMEGEDGDSEDTEPEEESVDDDFPMPVLELMYPV